MEVMMPDDLLELYETGDNRRYRKIAQNNELFSGFVRAVRTMEFVENIEELKRFSFLHYERLRFGLSGFSSVRLSNRYIHRLVFKEFEGSILIELIEIDDTHYGNKR